MTLTSKQGDAIEGQMAAHRRDLYLASVQLREACELLFRRWERKHGYRKGAGQLFILAGYDVTKPRMVA